MPIVKETSARLVKRNITHDAISRDVVQALTDPAALAIYTYLLTKPENWTVRKQEIIDHFSPMGADTYGRGMRQLRDLGLAWSARIKDENGRFMGEQIIVEQTFDQSPGYRKTGIPETPASGKSAPLKKKRISTEEENGIRGWDDWVNYRREIRKSITPTSEKKQLKQLAELTPEEQLATINQSISQGWTGLFPIRRQHNGTTQHPYRTGQNIQSRTVADRLRDKIKPIA